MSNKPQVKSMSLLTAGVITTISITLVLFLLGLTVLVGFTAKGFTSYLKENLGISIELSENLTDADIAKIQKNLDANPYIKSATFISKEEVKKQLVEDLGRDPEEVLGYDPSRSYFDVFVKSDYVNPDSMKLVEKSLKGGKLIKNVVYSPDDIANANSNLSMVGTILLVLALILVFISFTLIRSIIQLNIYSKRFLINTMRLVGATNTFIRRPFVWSMIGSGIIAAILANIAITGVVYYVTNVFPVSISIVSMNELLMVYASVFAFGIIIAALATISAVNRYLRMTTNKLYHV
ncbi:cell division protein FtsX [Dysgonomonas sp. ZJ279]|uniref:cell division protein FtsX n=1 Tax=Dysgonomonas sp. ZJ279 TaxID=2709796 RepID=UPI0013EDE973|nr:permease-like cell division protein FtsX [Dysgonomonas sp. ZJ279]